MSNVPHMCGDESANTVLVDEVVKQSLYDATKYRGAKFKIATYRYGVSALARWRIRSSLNILNCTNEIWVTMTSLVAWKAGAS